MTLLFATELSELFAEREEGQLAQVPAAITGAWVKDGHRFSITEEDLDDIVRNFRKRGNGEVVVDYEHASENPAVARGGPVVAAGWIQKLSIRDGEKGRVLWASVEFTKDAKKLIADRKYKYFSPAIDWGAADKTTGRSKGATLTSGALTNHPFLEELPAIQLSEKAGKIVVKTKEETMQPNNPYHVDGSRPDRGGRAEAERRAAKIDEPASGDETEELSEANLPSLTLRRMKPGHHAAVGRDGKIRGFIPHEHLMSYAQKAEGDQDGATAEVMQRTKRLMANDDKLSYGQAHAQVLASDADLATRYRNEHSRVLL